MWEDYIGQDHLKSELSNLLNYPVSILLRGRSGFGKTALAIKYAESRGNYDYQLGNQLKDGFFYNQGAVTHVIDEIHELKDPELLYPFIDAGMTFVFCTNETNNLKEPLRNRCIERFLKEYSDSDLYRIVKLRNIDFPSEIIKIITNRSRGVPRTALQLAFLCKVNCINLSINSVIDYLESSGIFENGFTYRDLQYLSFIKRAKKASLNTLKSNLSMPEDEIRTEIEPYLIKKGLISVTSSGRTYIGD